MDWLIVIIAGITGTALMTLFINIWTYITGFEYRVPSILGTLVTMSTRPSGKVSGNKAVVLIGYIFHFLIGIFFSIVYYLLWLYLIGRPEWGHLIYLGCGSGLVAAIFWYSILKLHPLAPKIKLPSYLFLIFSGHFIFTAGVIASWMIMK